MKEKEINFDILEDRNYSEIKEIDLLKRSSVILKA